MDNANNSPTTAVQDATQKADQASIAGQNAGLTVQDQQKYLQQMLDAAGHFLNNVRSFVLGLGTASIRMDPAYGMWAGALSFASAAFKVALNGDTTITNLNVTTIAPYADSAFIAATLLNSWSNPGSPYYNAAYCKSFDGYVNLRGRVTGGSSGVIMTLPSGYRPTFQLEFPVVANNAFGMIDIGSDGNVVLNVGTRTNVSLDGIIFKV